jgi:hypothetical protein
MLRVVVISPMPQTPEPVPRSRVLLALRCAVGGRGYGAGRSSGRVHGLGQVDRLHAQPGSRLEVASLARPGQGIGQLSQVDLPVTHKRFAELGDPFAEQRDRVVSLPE